LKQRHLIYLFLLSVYFCNTCFALNIWQFPSEEQETRYQLLVKEFRCPRCQNQNLVNSDAPIAIDLRRTVYEMVIDDQSNSTIRDYMLERYGDFILYRPKLSSVTFVLWFGPIALLLLGGFILWRIVSSHKAQKHAHSSKDLSQKEKAQLQQILIDQDN